MSIIENAYKYLRENLKDTRYIHTLGVVSVAKKLAALNNVSEEKAEIAALCHDIGKNLPKDEMLKIMKDNNIILSEDEKATPELWHSIISPVIAKNVLGITEEEILNAARWHTTGKENMSTLEKIIYISDMIEPSRIYEGVDQLRKITIEDLDDGVLAGINQTTTFLLSKGAPIDLNTIKARNYLILNKKKRG